MHAKGPAGLVLAAGLGKRMGGRSAKALYRVGRQTMLERVLDSARASGCERIVVVVGYEREKVIALLPRRAEYCVQEEQLGTGHAAMCASGAFEGWSGDVLVLCADVPLIRPATLKRLLERHKGSGAPCTVLTMGVPPPSSYGRIVRDGRGRVVRIVEARDATEEEARIDEVNSGTYAFDSEALFSNLPRLTKDNAQGEYYLTDVVSMIIRDGGAVEALRAEESRELMGVDSPESLAAAETLLEEWGEE